MMASLSRHILFSVLTLLWLGCGTLSAQHQYDVWQFGYYAGIDFRGGNPVPRTAPFYTDEGSTMWCDPTTGALKFSTDGRRVYCPDGSVMPNGVGMRGGPSSSSSALIVPNPTNSIDAEESFYVFCIGDQSGIDSTKDDSSLTVNMVDFSTDSAGVVTQKNTVITNGLSEKLAATQHCDGRSMWVLVHARSEPVFYAYNVSVAGIGIPVISRVGKQLVSPTTNVRGGPYGQGLLAFSVTGTKVAMAVPFSYTVEVFDFDIATGIVSNPVVVDSTSRTYGVCFSPSGNMLYTVEWVPTNNAGPPVRQFDLDAKSAPVVVGRLNDDDIDFHLGGIQLGPDGAIWLAESDGLASIAAPDLVGTSCLFRTRSVRLSPPSHIIIGLPNLITSYFDRGLRETCAPPQAGLQADTVVCQYSCIQPLDISKNKPVTWTWLFEGGSPATFDGPKPPTICFDQTGMFTATLIATNRFGADTTHRRIRVVPVPSVSAGADVVLCDSVAGYLHATGAVRYEWESQQGIGNRLSADPMVRVFEHTVFVVRGWNEDGCTATDSVLVYSFPQGKPPIELRVNSVSGMAGGLATVEVVRGAGLLSSDFDVELHLPSEIMMDLVVTTGTEKSRSRPSIAEHVLRIHPLDVSADVLAQVQVTLMMSNRRLPMTVSGIPNDSCDDFIGIPGLASSDACGTPFRMVTIGLQPLVVDGVTNGAGVQLRGTPQAAMQLDAWSIEGKLLGRVEFVMPSEATTITLPCPVSGLVLLRLCSGDSSTSRMFYVQ